MSEPEHLPDSNPRVIVGISRAEEERAFRLGGKKHAIDVPSQAQLVVVDPYQQSEDPLLAELVEEQALKPGIVLVRSPFKTGKYVDERDAELAFEREKLQLVSQLCQILGATRVSSDSSSLRVERNVTTVKAKAGKKLGRLVPYRGQASVSLDEQEKWQQRLTVDDLYPGGAPDISAAQQFIKDHALMDPEIRSLVQARAGENSLHERTITISYEGQQDRNLDIAAEVHLPQATVSGSLRRSHSTRNRVSLNLHIWFA